MTQSIRPAVVLLVPALLIGLLVFALAQALRSGAPLPIDPSFTAPGSDAAPAASPLSPTRPVENVPLASLPPGAPAASPLSSSAPTAPAVQPADAPRGSAQPSAPPSQQQTKDPGPGRPMGDNDPPWPYQREKGPYPQ